MIVVLKSNENVKESIEKLSALVKEYDIKVVSIEGEVSTIVGLVGDTAVLSVDSLAGLDYVEKVMRVQEPFKRANRKFHKDNTEIKVGNTIIGGKKIVIMAGPCSVESNNQLLEIAKSVKKSGADILRGGAFKPRTSPYAFQGLKKEGLEILQEVRSITGLPIISEITNIENIEMFEKYVDIIQVGARNMQNFDLLKNLGMTKKPILIKRGFSNTIDELLMSAEYVMSGGNENVILCERGIRTFETRTRNTLDISAIPLLKKLSHLPVIVDPSHASGRNDLVKPLALASIASGADGLIIEVHNDPTHALCDGAQSLTPEQFQDLEESLAPIIKAVNRE